MEVTRIRRLVNPSRSTGRKSTARFFGDTRKRKTAKRKPAAKNPASIITLGLINPERKATKSKGKKKMAATKKQLAALRKARAARRPAKSNPHLKATRKANTHRRKVTATRKKNSTRIYVMPRKANRGKKRNPDMFGMRGTSAGKAILAGLVGVYATKTVTPLVANAVPQVGSSPIISALLSAAIAWGGGAFITKYDKTMGEGFMFGGLMQAGSQLLNLVVPSNPLSLSGLGDFVSIAPTGFPVPSNDIMRAMAARQQLNAPAMPSAPGVASGMGVASLFR